MSETLKNLRIEHRHMKHLLDLLERQVDLFAHTERPDYDLIREILDYFLTFPDLYHHPKEDIVFRRLSMRDPARAAEVGDLLHEHEEISDRLHHFSRAVINVMLDAEISREVFVEIAQGFITGERKHMAIEEERFFPAVTDGLSAEDWAEIDAKTAPFIDPLADKEMGHQFQRLRAVLNRWQTAAV